MSEHAYYAGGGGCSCLRCAKRPVGRSDRWMAAVACGEVGGVLCAVYCCDCFDYAV